MWTRWIQGSEMPKSLTIRPELSSGSEYCQEQDYRRMFVELEWRISKYVKECIVYCRVGFGGWKSE